MTWPGVLFWILLIIGVFTRGPFLLYLFFAFGPFMALAMIPNESVGVNLVAQSVCAVFLICKMVLFNGQLRLAFDTAIDPARLGLLFIFLIYGYFTAYVMPRLFSHLVEVIPINANVPWAVPLEPTSANFTQPAYMTLSIGMALAFYLAGGNASFRRHFLQAVLVGSFVLIGTGLVDIVFSAVGLGDTLDVFRNAKYGLLVNVEMAGARRVVGLTPEASSFGSACVGAAASLAFLRPCFDNPFWRDRLVPVAIFGSIAMAALSTSSTAYVGLAIFGLVYGGNWLRRALSPDAPARESLKWEAGLVLAATFMLVAVIVLAPNMLDSVYEMIDQTIFKKTESDSYAERSMWTRVGMEALYTTGGLGVGLGSERTSNWYVGILCNTGIIGSALLAWFIVRLYIQRCRGDRLMAEFATALKFSLLPGFVMGALAGTTPDLGVGVGATLGLIASLIAMDRSRPELGLAAQASASNRAGLSRGVGGLDNAWE
ncbi:hypothetical protein CU048_15660 [Beijerinckiaceae bacterium]|nr:hypothetical protein CU048_15660 [Beijerinckiaceae bacterium]